MSSRTSEASTVQDSLRSFPMARAEGCPFSPPPAGVEAQSEAPLTRVRLWDGSTPWLVTRYAEAKQILADPRVSSNAKSPGYPAPVQPADTQGEPEEGAPEDERPQGAGFSFILMDDPEHARLRRMATGQFTVKKVEALRSTVQKIADDLIDEMLRKPAPVDLVEEFALPLPSLVICEVLGVPYEQHDFFQQHSRTIVARESDQSQQADAFTALATYLGGLLGEKIADPGDDFLSELGQRVSAGDLAPSDAVQMAILLLFAGHETTANMIALGTLALLENPTQLDKMREPRDQKFLASATDEMLRYLTIIHDSLKRVATADIVIGDETIREGDGILIALELSNHDESVFPSPDELDLERNPKAHVAFGFGVHQCLGQPLARMELQVVYPTLLRRIPSLRLAGEIEHLPFKEDGVVYGVHKLPVTW